MKERTKKLTESGILIALATVLSFIKVFQMPFGGEVTLISMLPIILNSYRNGIYWGLGSGAVYSIIQILTGLSTVRSFFMPDEGFAVWIAFLIILIDYILAYTVLGFGGIFRNKIKNRPLSVALGTFVALLLRYVCHFISGYLFYGAWAEWFFSQENFYKVGQTILQNFSGNALAAIYSLFYNGLYMIPEIIITTIAALLIGVIPYVTQKRK